MSPFMIPNFLYLIVFNIRKMKEEEEEEVGGRNV